MRYVLILLLVGCVTTSEVHLANGSKGYNIGCSGAVQNYGACLEKAGEICGAKGFAVVNQEGDAVPFSVAAAQASASRQSASGTFYGQSSSIVTRNLFIQCKQ